MAWQAAEGGGAGRATFGAGKGSAFGTAMTSLTLVAQQVLPRRPCRQSSMHADVSKHVQQPCKCIQTLTMWEPPHSMAQPCLAHQLHACRSAAGLGAGSYLRSAMAPGPWRCHGTLTQHCTRLQRSKLQGQDAMRTATRQGARARHNTTGSCSAQHVRGKRFSPRSRSAMHKRLAERQRVLRLWRAQGRVQEGQQVIGQIHVCCHLDADLHECKMACQQLRATLS